jgi:hypothetical protein
MMQRVLIGSLVSAVVLFMWGFCFWMLSPVPKMMMKEVPNEAGVAEALRAYIKEDGHYFLPFGCDVMRSGDEEAKKEFQQRFERGPLASITFRTRGDTKGMGLTMALGFGHVFACSLVASLLLCMSSIPTFGGRWAFVALLGVFATGVVTFCQPIWFMASWHYSLLYAGFDVVGWALAAVPLAGIIRTAKA